MARKPTAGRFTVGDRSAPTLGAATSLGLTLAMQTDTNQYVRDFAGTTLVSITQNELPDGRTGWVIRTAHAGVKL